MTVVPQTVTVAAVADVNSLAEPGWSVALRHAAGEADLLLLAGDLTAGGTVEQARQLATQLAKVGLPTVAVLGDHDHHADQADTVTAVLTDHGVTVLDGTAATVTVGGTTVGVAGIKGLGGGFPGADIPEHGDPETRRYAAASRLAGLRLSTALDDLDTDIVLTVTHYAPCQATLQGQRPEQHAWLGSRHLGDAIDRHRVDLAIHGHAPRGREYGSTPGGVDVRNVGRSVIRAPYRLYRMSAVRA